MLITWDLDWGNHNALEICPFWAWRITEHPRSQALALKRPWHYHINAALAIPPRSRAASDSATRLALPCAFTGLFRGESMLTQCWVWMGRSVSSLLYRVPMFGDAFRLVFAWVSVSLSCLVSLSHFIVHNFWLFLWMYVKGAGYWDFSRSLISIKVCVLHRTIKVFY